ncbi:MAG TPA: WD40 repeat domain-containing protein, partial [Saprospiraceae bacterium]|nr:WD40 repeat domain-containing protein [Saprospiraceae bacterium]
TLKNQIAQIWDAETGNDVYAFLNITAVAVSEDGLRLALADKDGKIKVYRTSDFTAIEEFTTDHLQIEQLAISKDSTVTVAAAYLNNIFLFSSQSSVQEWTAHQDKIWAVSFSPTGKLLLTVSDDNTTKLWTYGQKEEAVMKGHNNDVYCGGFSSDGIKIFTGSEDRTVRMWDLEGHEVGTFLGHSKDVQALCASHKDYRVASADEDGNVLIWKVRTLAPNLNASATKTFKHGKELKAAEGSDRDIKYALYPKRDLILAYSNNQVQLTNLYGAQAETIYLSLPDARAFAIPDTASFLSGYRNGFLMRHRRKANALKEEQGSSAWVVTDSLKAHNGTITAIAFSPDGKQFVTGGWDGRAVRWNALTMRPIDTLRGHTDRIHCVAISTKGQVLTGCEDGTAILWAADGKVLHVLSGHTHPILSVAFHPEGHLCVTGSADKTARIWNVESGTAQTILQEGHEDQISAVLFSPDGKTVLSGSVDNSLIIWTLGGEPVIRMTGHPSDISAMAFTPDGDILSADRRGQINAWYTIENYIDNQVDRVSVLDLVNHGLDLEDAELDEIRDADVYAALARRKEEKQRWEEAYRLYTSSLGVRTNVDATLGQYRSSSHLPQVTYDFSLILSHGNASIWMKFAQVLFDEKKHLNQAAAMLERAEQEQHTKDQLLLLHRIATYQKQNFDLNRFTNSTDADDLYAYGNYFNNRGRYLEAAQMYRKADSLAHTPQRRIDLQRALVNAGKTLPLEAFLQADRDEELTAYASYFYNRSDWEKAWQLYDKSFKLQYEGKVLLQLQRIAERIGRNVDFGLFLKADKYTDLSEFANYFRTKARDVDRYSKQFKQDNKEIPSFHKTLLRALWDRTRQLQERLYTLQPTPNNLINWYAAAVKIGPDKGIQVPQKEHFTRSKNPGELQQYANFFLAEKNWAYAEELYLKIITLDSTGNNPDAISGLYQIYRQDKRKDKEMEKYYREMLKADKPDILLRYASTVRPTEEMSKQRVDWKRTYDNVKRLEDKAFSIDPVEAVQRKKDLSETYNSLGWYQLFIPDSIGTGPRNCELSILRGIELDPSNLYLYTNLPTAYLLQNRWRDAEKIYLERKDQPYMPNRNLPFYRDVFLKDLEELEEGGIHHPGFECLRKLLTEGGPLPDDLPCKQGSGKGK